jgi:hypothetical protein
MKRQKALLLGVILLVGTFTGCKVEKKEYNVSTNNPEIYQRSVKKLTDIIVYDIFSPPVAARIYAYPNIAAYEVLVNEYPSYISLSGQLRGLNGVSTPNNQETYCFPLAANQSFC